MSALIGINPIDDLKKFMNDIPNGPIKDGAQYVLTSIGLIKNIGQIKLN